MMLYEAETKLSVRYLSSEAALQSIDADPYWPKWDAPWWHMLLLHEMGETRQIPQAMIERFVASLNRIPLKSFPIYPADMPEGIDPYRGSPCHCQLGNVYQVLSSWGVDVDERQRQARAPFVRRRRHDSAVTDG